MDEVTFSIRVLLVEDQALIRDVLSTLLTVDSGIDVIGEVGTLEDASRDATLHRPDVVVLDQGIEGTRGNEACAKLTRWLPELRVLMLSRFGDTASMVGAFRAGARGFALKESEPASLRHAVRTVGAGGTYIDPSVADRLVALVIQGLQPRGPHGLTSREMQILALLPKGLTNREIAAKLGVSIETVKTHVRGILRKLDVPDRVRAAGIAIREGLA